MLDAEQVTMPNTYLRLFHRMLGAAPALLEGTGETVARLDKLDGRNSHAAYERFVLNAIRYFTQPDVGLQMGRINRLANMHGQLSTAVANADSMLDCLKLVLRYGALRNPGVRFQWVEVGDHVGIDFAFRVEMGQGAVSIKETFMLAIDALVATVSGEHAARSRIEFDYPEPGYVSSYRASFVPRTLQFSQPHLRYLVPRDSLMLSTELEADSALRDQAVSRLEMQLSHAVSQMGIADQVDVVFANNPGHLWRLSEVAEALNLSPRTLQRRLRGAGINYQQLLGRWLMSQARQLLASPGHSVESVAVLLGYADVSNFRQACRRLTGQSPQALRQSLQTDLSR